MNFQIQPLAANKFAHLFALSDEELALHQATRVTVTSHPGTPCRVSMMDAKVGETVILLNYSHLPTTSPFASRHAIFVREDVADAKISINEVPEVLKSRVISVRLFDKADMMIDADLANGSELISKLTNAFENPDVAFVHLHYAKPGCFAASVYRA